MADNVAITAGTGTAIAADEVVDATLGTVKAQFIKIMDGTLDGTSKVAVKAASTSPIATDPALVVAISPNSVNANGGTTAANSAPVVPADQYAAYKAAPASATTTMTGAGAGALGDYLAGVVIIPGTAAAGTVSIQDGANTAISVFAGGGTTALTDLRPFFVPLGIFSTAGAWKIINGANVTAIGVGKFT